MVIKLSNRIIIATSDPLIPDDGVQDVTGDLAVDGDVSADSVVIKEAADHPVAPSATKGVLWVRDDAPNVLVFTDDDGTDAVLGSGAGSLEGLTVSNDGTKTTLSGIAGDYLRIGTANTTSHGFDTADDLVITGRTEFNGQTYFDASLNFLTDRTFNLGNAGDTSITYSSVPTNNTLIIGVGSASRTLLIVDDADIGFNWAGAVLPDPAVVVHSANQSTDEWVSLSHDRTSGQLSAGAAGDGAVTITTSGTARVKFDSSETIGGTAMLIAVDDGGGLTLRRVTVGTNDSGDGGFRVLQIPNSV